MDHFGIGAAITGAVSVLLRSARGTGRTVSLVESLKTGDRVVFTNEREAKRVQRLCKERGVEIEIMVVSPRTPQDLFNRGSLPNDGRALFDHSWVEDYYMNALERARGEIDSFQKSMSGYGEPHRETKRKAEELARWANLTPLGGGNP